MTAAASSTSIMGNNRGPNCAGCGRKIKQQQRLVTIEGEKFHTPTCDPRETRYGKAKS